MTVRVSIVLYQTDPAQLQRCLDSVLPSALVSAIDLVDNSPSACLQSCLPADPRLHYLHTGTNLGYGRGHNISLRRSLAQGCEFHLVLNADVRFDSGVIAKMVAFM
ncbi:MAG: glycosyltransferase, partial [Quisquiliibacterium sp.]